ncbi:helix-turn-helix domain-containing protein [Xanthobacter autotrophicus]|uniref:helix-turn-helix domain-containing protein n=1 Tax=Xanthobacter autotrophicus TaxID=280 RepID=UPI0024A7A07E|nr:helix-turn-helix domain-containing protein [Xanthobacter autotrophicus]MDI4656023.1 helix-turn-helix domain-containing protein [Xanthobacter autotrophicus]
MTDALLTLDEAASMLRICKVTLYKHIRAGRLSLRKLGRRSFILRSEVEIFLTNLPAIALQAK